MNFDVNLYECVNDDGLGRCHLLKKKKGKYETYYLFYVESNPEHYVVCDYICGEADSCSLGHAVYGSVLEEVLDYFNGLE